MKKIIIIFVIALIIGAGVWVFLNRALKTTPISADIQRVEQMFPDGIKSYIALQNVAETWKQVEKSNWYKDTNKISAWEDMKNSSFGQTYFRKIEQLEEKSHHNITMDDLMQVMGQYCAIASYDITDNLEVFALISHIEEKSRILLNLLKYQTDKESMRKYDIVEVHSLYLTGLGDVEYTLLGPYVAATNDSMIMNQIIDLALGKSDDSIIQYETLNTALQEDFLSIYYEQNSDVIGLESEIPKQILDYDDILIKVKQNEKGLDFNYQISLGDENNGLINQAFPSEDITTANALRFIPKNSQMMLLMNNFNAQAFWNFYNNDFFINKEDAEISKDSIVILEEMIGYSLDKNLISHLASEVFIASGGIEKEIYPIFPTLVLGLEINSSPKRLQPILNELLIYLLSEEYVMKTRERLGTEIYYFVGEDEEDNNFQVCYTFLNNYLLIGNNVFFLNDFIDTANRKAEAINLSGKGNLLLYVNSEISLKALENYLEANASRSRNYTQEDLSESIIPLIEQLQVLGDISGDAKIENNKLIGNAKWIIGK